MFFLWSIYYSQRLSKTLQEEAVGLHLTGSTIRHANCSSLCELQRSRQRDL